MKLFGLLGISRLRIGRFGINRPGLGRSRTGRFRIGRVGRFGIAGRQSEQRVRQGIGGTLAVVLALVLTLIPLVWMLLASVKSRNDLYAKPLRILPTKLIWHNESIAPVDQRQSDLRRLRG